MAKVTKSIETRKTIELVPQEIHYTTYTYNLSLTKDEVQVIKCLTGSVAQNNKARTITDNIYGALCNVGVINHDLNVKSAILFEGDFLNA